nr:MAG: putative coat protein [Leviviridae sp.]
MAVTLANPMPLTFNSVAKSLPRINQDNYGSEYYLLEATQSFRLKIRHSTESVQKDGTQFDRHNVELTHTVLPTSTTPTIVTQTYMVFRDLPTGTTPANLGYVSGALTGLMTSDNVGALFGWVN